MSSIAGKTAIVTGASAGIGAATARALRKAGARVAGGTRRVGEIEADFAHELDVTDPASCRRFVAEATGLYGAVDILVNNAGLGLGRDSFTESKEEDEEAVLEANVHGLVRMTRLCLPHMGEGAHIVNIGSVAGIWAYENSAVYCISKAAVRMFGHALREDLLGSPIRVTTISPGLVETEFSMVRFRGDEEKARAVYAGMEMGGPMRAEDVADCILFAVTRPPHVNVDEIVVMALGQHGSRIVRET